MRYHWVGQCARRVGNRLVASHTHGNTGSTKVFCNSTSGMRDSEVGMRQGDHTKGRSARLSHASPRHENRLPSFLFREAPIAVFADLILSEQCSHGCLQVLRIYHIDMTLLRKVKGNVMACHTSLTFHDKTHRAKVAEFAKVVFVEAEIILIP